MPDKQEYKRGYRACYGCRKRKVKCIFSESSTKHSSCERCKRELKECVIPPSTNRGGIANVLAGRAKKRARVDSIQDTNKRERVPRSIPQPANEFPVVATSTTAIVLHDQQHPQVPGAIATHVFLDEVPHHSPIPTPPILSRLDPSADESAASASSPLLHSGDSRQSRNPLEMISWSGDETNAGVTSRSKHIPPHDRMHMGPPPQGIPIKETHMVSKGLLTEHELVLLHRFYVERMNPFFPYLPDWLLDLEKTTGMNYFLSILICASIRYFTTSAELGIQVSPEKTSLEVGIVARKADLYARAWDLVNSYVGFDLALFELPDGYIGTLMASIMIPYWGIAPIDKERDAKYLSEAERVYYGARRCDRLWLASMVMSSILVETIGFENMSPKTYVAQKLMDVAITSRLNRQIAASTFIEVECPDRFAFEEEDQAKLELLRITTLASRLLYQSPFASVDVMLYPGQHIFLLEAMKPHLELWTLKYHKYLSLDSGEYFTNYEVALLFHHLRIFIYRLALPPQAHNDESLRFSGYYGCESFLFSAIESAKEIIRVFETIRHKTCVRFLPTPWISQILHGITFLIKAVIFCPVACHGEADILETLDMIANVSREIMESRAGFSNVNSHYASVLLSTATRWKAAIDTMSGDHHSTLDPTSDSYFESHSGDVDPDRDNTLGDSQGASSSNKHYEAHSGFRGLSDQDFHDLSTRLADLMDKAAIGCTIFPAYQ